MDALDGERISRRSTAHDVAMYIRRQIWEGNLRPGARIPQDEVADVLGVSRMPVREALIALESEGLVENVLHRGAFVCELDEAAIKDHYDLYGMVYGLAVQRGVERGGPDVVDQAHATSDRLMASDDPTEVRELVLQFTHSLVLAADSPRLAAAVRGLERMVPGNFFEVIPGGTEVARRGIANCVEALDRGDPEGVGEACREMFRQHGDLVVDVLQGRGLLTARD